MLGKLPSAFLFVPQTFRMSKIRSIIMILDLNQTHQKCICWVNLSCNKISGRPTVLAMNKEIELMSCNKHLRYTGNEKNNFFKHEVPADNMSITPFYKKKQTFFKVRFALAMSTICARHFAYKPSRQACNL